MFGLTQISILLTGAALVLCDGSSTQTCPSPLVWTECGSACKETCDSPPSLICTLQCVQGCFCPPEFPVEKRESDGSLSCVASRDECCPEGQVWNDCGSECNRTCDDPHPTCSEQCVPRCECPPHAPIQKEGQCVSLSQCICPDGQCSKFGCYGCNKCQCRDKGAACTRRSCPDVRTPEGVEELYANGCWRQSPSGGRCIFFSPCVDSSDYPDCTSQPEGFCNECNKCTCSPDEHGTGLTPTCEVNAQSCMDELSASISQGCWSHIKGDCHFTYPCLKTDRDACPQNSAGNGLRTCDACRTCECVHGARICEQKDHCPDPYRDGCYVPRHFPGARAGCYFVSPCPFNSSVSDFNQCLANPTGFVCKSCASCSCKNVLSGGPCPVASCLQPKADFCYAFNDATQTCEFVSPCPQTCDKTDTVCNECNECSCQDGGSTQCSFNQCENPLSSGCWYNSSSGCEFRVPCPEDAVVDQAAFCKANPGATYCPAKDCNMCRCSDKYGGPSGCTRKACREPALSLGCYKQTGSGRCSFSLPCEP